MPHDIDIIQERVRASVPDVQIEQLSVTHEADDDGLWFFRVAGKVGDIQLESSTYNLPFRIESSASSKSQTVATADEAVEVIKAFFTRRT